MEKYAHQLLDWLLPFMGGLTPAALGAAVSLAYERGISWADRFTQFAVGVIVSYFAGNVVASLWPSGRLDPFVLQGMQFTLGMIAFKATPRFASSVTDLVAELPRAIWRRWFPKGDAQ